MAGLVLTENDREAVRVAVATALRQFNLEDELKQNYSNINRRFFIGLGSDGCIRGYYRRAGMQSLNAQGLLVLRSRKSGVAVEVMSELVTPELHSLVEAAITAEHRGGGRQ